MRLSIIVTLTLVGVSKITKSYCAMSTNEKKKCYGRGRGAEKVEVPTTQQQKLAQNETNQKKQFEE